MALTGTLGSLQVIIGANVKQAVQGLNTLKASLTGAVGAAQLSVRRIASAMRSIPVIVGGALGGLAVKIGADFETAITNVGSLFQASRDEIKKLSQEVVPLANRLGVNATDAANALYDIQSAGIAGADGLMVLEAATKAGIAGITNTQIAADALTTVLNSFGLEADKASEVAGKLFQVVEGGKITFPDLAQSIGTVAKSASNAGVSLDELGAAIATATKVGVPVEQTFTGIQQVIVGLLNPSVQAKKAIEGVLGSTAEASIANIGFAATLKKVIDSAKGSQTALGELFPNVRALRVAAVLAGEGFNEFTSQVERFQQAGAGKLDEVFAIQNRTISRSFAALKNNILNTLKLIVIEASEAIQNVLNTIAGWIKANQDLVKTILKIGLAVGGTLAVIAPLGIALQVLAFSMGGINIAIGVFFKVLTSGLGAVKGFTSLVFGLVGAMKGFYGLLVSLPAVFKTITVAIFNFKAIVVGLTLAINAAAAATFTWDTALAIIAAPIAAVAVAAGALLAAAVALTGGIALVGGAFKLWNERASLAENAMSLLRQVIQSVRTWAIAAAKSFAEWAVEFAFFEKAEAIFDGIWRAIKAIAGAVASVVVSFGRWVGILGEAEDGLSVMKQAFTFLRKVFESFVNFLVTFDIGSILKRAAFVASIAWQKFVLVYRAAMATIAIATDYIVNRVIGPAWNSITNVVAKVILGIQLQFTKLKLLIAPIWNELIGILIGPLVEIGGVFTNYVVNPVLKGINFLIEQANKIPAVELPKLTVPEFDRAELNKAKEQLIGAMTVDEDEARKTVENLREAYNTFEGEKYQGIDILSGPLNNLKAAQDELAKLESDYAEFQLADRRRRDEILADINRRRDANVARRKAEQAAADALKAAEDGILARVKEQRQVLLGLAEARQKAAEATRQQAEESAKSLAAAKEELRIAQQRLFSRRGTATNPLAAAQGAISKEQARGPIEDALKGIFGKVEGKDLAEAMKKVLATIAPEDVKQFNAIVRKLIENYYETAANTEEAVKAVELGQTYAREYNAHMRELQVTKRQQEELERKARYDQIRAEREYRRLVRQAAKELGITVSEVEKLISDQEKLAKLDVEQKKIVQEIAAKKQQELQQQTATPAADIVNEKIPATPQSQTTQSPLAQSVNQVTQSASQVVDSVSSLSDALNSMMYVIVSTFNTINNVFDKLSLQVAENTSRIVRIERNIRTTGERLGGAR